ncbi:4'-phosphopantetheinyl transferase family protein [Streptomyces sp. NBC_01803]|uniref:4'-phosphopantetheinyl transferase family protein n=1 Tax=Streptomyces sp. NBC_01803 TaxID=2975946 RepID=UPI002DD889BF|nr:4'-phosphopantetheinyl transferase superfamily protein [Streptomyces sp. NBC_01803]WSA44264.1 4'-phosphopantetheinyl transferase superfamily protein [Streptomyces sp. NBC_01803]
MIQRLLPSAVACATATADLPDAGALPEEAAALSSACGEPRRREFLTTRTCARAAMVSLGVPPAGVPSGPKGEPRWPAGLTGSMTHCDGYRAAAVSRTSDFHVVAIDAERHVPLPADVARHITVPAERAHLAELARHDPGTHWETVLFSAKETVYKAFNPLTGRWLGFRDARLSFDPATRTFRARLLQPGPVVDGVRINEFAGRWSVGEGLALTAIALPATAADRLLLQAA